MSKVVALCGDNCRVNQSLSTKSGIALVGCASHCFNLAMHDLVVQLKEIIELVRSVIKKLTFLLQQRNYDETLKTSVITRCSSVAEKLSRFFKMKDFITLLQMEDANMLMPSNRDLKKIEALLSELKQAGGVTKALHKDDLTVADAKALFNTDT